MNEVMYAMLDPNGKIMDDTIQRTKKRTKYTGAVWGRVGRGNNWRSMKRRGYKIVTVNVDVII